ncbi:MAG: HAD family hydrolase [Planctomycetia bacterium]|nr:HAD family hydrolase [Planctomycetia bacterium]
MAETVIGHRFPEGVRAVVFDVVGTLVEPSPSVAEAYARVGLRHGAPLETADIQRRFHAAWRRQEIIDAAAVPAYATSAAREMDRWREIVADVFDRTSQSDAIFTDLWEHFGRPDAWRPLPAGTNLARAAVDAGLTVALASNFDERLFAISGVIEPLSWAHHVFASSEIGWRKPAAEFFRTVERRLGHGPHELVLVGDDPELDIAAATRAGWHSHPIA